MAIKELDWIHLEDFSFPCVLGLFDWEQRTTQTLSVEARMGLDLDPAATGEIARSVDYSQTLEHIQHIAQHGRWRMLESMATAMARQILAPPAPGEQRAQVSEVILRLFKPEVFKGRAVPSIEIRRSKEWCQLPVLAANESGVHFEVLNQTAESGAYRVHLASGARWTVPKGMSCVVISGRVRVGDRELLRGDRLGESGSSAAEMTSDGACLLAAGECHLLEISPAQK